MSRGPLTSFALTLCILGSMPIVAQTLPVGSEFQVNTYTTSSQFSSAVATFSDESFVVVWESLTSEGTDTSQMSIQGQRFDGSGIPIGDQFQVNTYTTGRQRLATVAAQPSGAFVVVWQSGDYCSSGAYGYCSEIQAQRYAENALPIGVEVQINTYSTNEQGAPAVATTSDGGFVVVWESRGSDGTDTLGMSIQGQRYDASAFPSGPQFQVNTYTSAHQFGPVIATGANGDFVVVWASYGSYGTDYSQSSIQAQRYAPDGSPMGGQFQVNTAIILATQSDPSVAMDTDGAFVVVWQEGCLGCFNRDTSIQAQRYAPDGLPIGGEFQVNTYTTTYQQRPAVATDAGGGFVVVWDSGFWSSPGPDGSGYSIQAQRFASDGSPNGVEFQVNTYTTSYQTWPAVAKDGQRGFVVVWQSDGSSGSDTSGFSIQGQRYEVPVLIDGFESGDLSAWSVPIH